MGNIPLDSGTTYKEYALLNSMIVEAKVFWIIVLVNLVVFEVESFDMRSAMKFYS